MNLNNEQRLIVAMLASIQRKLGVTEFEDAVCPDFVLDAVEQSQQWAIVVRYPGLFLKEQLPEAVARVYEYLEMWHHLESAYAGLASRDRRQVSKLLGLGTRPLRMLGFNVNAEMEYLAVARFIVAHMQAFPGFAGRMIEVSDRPTLGIHQAMLARYRHAVGGVPDGHIAAEHLVHIVKG